MLTKNVNKILIKSKRIYTLDILYYMPDYRHIIQQLILQYQDVPPELPRINKFLSYWHENIEAVIAEVKIAESYSTDWRRII